MAVLLLLPAFAFAQKVTVRGVVVDETGAPLSGAAVLVQGTSQGTVTGSDGTFSLSAEEGKALVVSYLGYTDQTVRAAGKYLTINLEPDANYLQDVVVVGYDTQKKVNLTGSVATVSTADFGSRPIVQASTALQGMAPGVTVTTAGGAPGADAGTIQIRGIGSFGGSSSSPLILIDGVEGNLNLLDATQIDQIPPRSTATGPRTASSSSRPSAPTGRSSRCPTAAMPAGRNRSSIRAWPMRSST